MDVLEEARLFVNSLTITVPQPDEYINGSNKDSMYQREGAIVKPSLKYEVTNRCDLWCRDSGSIRTSERIISQAQDGDRDAASHLSWCKECQKVAKKQQLEGFNQVKLAATMHRAGVQDPDCSKHPGRSHDDIVRLAWQNDYEAKHIVSACLGCQVHNWNISER